MRRLVLIDSHAIIHRAYHALPPMYAPNGQLVNAVYGFTTMLLRVIDDLRPTYLIAAFDLPAPTFRHKEYIGYQAHRPATEENMRSQIEIVKETVRAAGIPIYEYEGFEADDIIGTLAKQAASKRTIQEVIIVTGDRDALQLVSRKVKIYSPVKGLTETTMFNKKKTMEYMGVDPDQIVDYKALVGDSSDNYPGVPGIGPKTAAALLGKFGSLRNIYKELERTEKLNGFPDSVAAKLRKGRDSAFLSQRLARIVVDAPIKLSLTNARLHKLRREQKFLSHLRMLGFKSIVKRLTGEDALVASTSSIRRSSFRKKTQGQDRNQIKLIKD